MQGHQRAMIIRAMNALTAPPTSSPANLATFVEATDGAVALTHMGIIRAQGADAVKFLHGQLSNDVALQGMSEARLAAFCSPKGRMQASFVYFKLAADDVLLVCSRDLLPTVLKRLSMFVMRAQCKLSDATDQFTLWGLVGATANRWAAAAQLAPTQWAKATLTDNAALPAGLPTPATLVRLPSAGTGPQAVTRLLGCTPASASVQASAANPDVWQAPALTTENWQLLSVRSAVVMVSQPVVEAFVPQMLNYESVGGVNFKKGCYPGQEVVARSQFRGTLKRRAFHVRCDAPLAVGQDVFHSSDTEQPCGTVVASAPARQGFEAVVSMLVSAADGGVLTLGSATGPTLTVLPLPYALLADI